MNIVALLENAELHEREGHYLVTTNKGQTGIAKFLYGEKNQPPKSVAKMLAQNLVDGISTNGDPE